MLCPEPRLRQESEVRCRRPQGSFRLEVRILDAAVERRVDYLEVKTLMEHRGDSAQLRVLGSTVVVGGRTENNCFHPR